MDNYRVYTPAGVYVTLFTTYDGAKGAADNLGRGAMVCLDRTTIYVSGEDDGRRVPVQNLAMGWWL